MPVLFQLSFTSIFGGVAAVMFVKTRNCIAPIVMHALCNLMSIPKFSWVGLTSPWDYGVAAAYVVGLLGFITSLFLLDSESFKSG